MKKQKIKIGDKVQWTCKPKAYEKPFECKGIVTDIRMSTFGSCLKSMGAIIKVNSKKYHNFYGKKKTFISVKNLQLV